MTAPLSCPVAFSIGVYKTLMTGIATHVLGPIPKQIRNIICQYTSMAYWCRY